MSKENKKKKRFETIEGQGFGPDYRVVRDNETGVLYLETISGITTLVDQNGNPLVDTNF